MEPDERSAFGAMLRRERVHITQGRPANLDVLEGRSEVAVEQLTPLLDRPGFEERLVTPLPAVLAWAHLEMGDVD